MSNMPNANALATANRRDADRTARASEAIALKA
jgi:hypothetical protein